MKFFFIKSITAIIKEEIIGYINVLHVYEKHDNKKESIQRLKFHNLNLLY